MTSKLRAAIELQLTKYALAELRESRGIKSAGNRDYYIDEIIKAFIAALPEKTYSLRINDEMMTMPSELHRNNAIDEIKEIFESQRV